jgi:hypothetical protein
MICNTTSGIPQAYKRVKSVALWSQKRPYRTVDKHSSCFCTLQDNGDIMKIRMNVIDHSDVHFVCILADDEVEITSYLFDVQFRVKFKQYKKLE